MSKLFKSQEYVQAHPCRLEPIDVDAFFINSQVDENNAQTADTEEMPADSQEIKKDDTQSENMEHEIVNSEVAEKPESVSVPENSGKNLKKQTVAATEGFDLKHLANVAEQIGALIDGAQPDNTTGVVKDISSILFGAKREASASSTEIKPETADFMDEKKRETESLLSRLKRDTANIMEELKQETSPGFLKAKPQEESKREAEKIFFEAKNRALNLTEGAKTPEEHHLNDVKNNILEQTEGAKKQSGLILDGAKQKAGEIVTNANHQADKIINDAKQQAELVIETARQTGDNLIQHSNEQADEIIKSAKQQEEELIKAAKDEGEKLLAAARGQAVEQAVAIKEQAHAEGLQTGRQEGAAQIRAELEKNLTTALSLVMQAEQEVEKRITSSEPEMLKLAVYIAEKIIGDEIKLDGKRQLDIIREALSRVTTATNLVIRLEPDDCNLISENISSLQEVFSEPKPIKLEGDPAIPKGSCFIETDHGNIDARIKSQLDMIMTELLKVGRIQ